MFGEPASASGPVFEWPLDWPSLKKRPGFGGREAPGTRICLLWRRSRRRRGRVPNEQIQGRLSVRTQSASRKGVVFGTISGLGAERRAFDEVSRSAFTPDRTRMVRRIEREMAFPDSRAGRAIHGQIPD